MTRLSKSLNQLIDDYDHLARRSGVPVPRLKDLSEGSEPSISEVRAISKALKLSIPSLLSASERMGRSDLRFRSSKHQSTAVAEARLLSVVDALRSCIKHIPSTNAVHHSATLKDGKTIEQAALKVREKILSDELRLDPVPNLAHLLDRAGFAHIIRLKNLTVHGAAIEIDGRSIIFTASQFPPRSLFSIAHELGHLIFAHTQGDRIIIDTDNVGYFGSENDDERLCDSFASSLLIPAESLARYLQILRKQYSFDERGITTTEILFVSNYFATSFLTAAFRFELLGLLPRGGALALETAIKEEHGSPEKLAALGGIPRRVAVDIPIVSAQLQEALKSALLAGDISIGYISDAFGFSVGEMKNALM